MFEARNWPRSVVDIDDLPSGVYQSMARHAGSLRERLFNQLQAISWKRREATLAERFTTVAVCSENDRRRLKGVTSAHVIPNGFERPDTEPRSVPATPPRFGFIGLFDYFANLEGVRWFVKKCWPLVQAEVPGARLRLIGRGSDGPIASLGPHVEGLGWVEDATSEIATWSAMIVPVHQGGGTRTKIAEGFSRKCPIVSTSIGAYGYEVEDGNQLRLADSPAEFARACVAVVRDPSGAAKMAERAWSDFLIRWTWDAIAPRVWATAEDCLQRSRTS
jgi:glycosyltransferase involved in cell wall biosynthesis